MIMKGQKRKFPPEDMEVSDRTSLAWENQRQFVFSVSLSKYQRGQELPEPSLRRSVLIANTLRQINLDASVDREPSPPPPLQTEEQESVFQSESIAADSLAQQASPNCAAGRAPSNCFSTPVEEEDWGSMSTDPDFSLSAAVSSILTALDSTIDGSPQAAPRTPLRSLENLTGFSEGGVAWMKQGVRGHGGGWEQQQEECRVEGMRSGYLSDLTVEDLFQDIDTSLLERDMGILGLRGSGGGFQAGDDLLRYLPPFSPPSSSSSSHLLSLNQNLKCLPSFASFSPSSFSPNSAPPSSPFSGQNHMREGLELEHLMEILVES